MLPLLALLSTFLAAAPGPAVPPVPRPLLTAAEKSGYRRTTPHALVVTLLDRLAARSPFARRLSLGESSEGRELAAIVLSDPPVESPQQARRLGKLVFFAFGGIHGGEICGKEALLQFARELVLSPDAPASRLLLDRLVLVLQPLENADGNERISPDNRPGQVGPAEGMGQRANARGLDLNRDHVKLESPEVRAHVRFLTRWDPDVVLDTHTTDGSLHRYDLTFAAPQNPAGPAAPRLYTRDRFLPEVSRRLRTRHGVRTFFYGNFDPARTIWSTYSSKPRFGCPYRGLRGHLAILSEAYAYAPFERRVGTTLAFVRECALLAAERRDEILALRRRARTDTVRAGEHADGRERIGIRHRSAAFPGKVLVESWLPAVQRDGEHATEAVPVTFAVRHEGRFEATRWTTRPRAYLLPPDLPAIAAKLSEHGIEVEKLTQPLRAPVEVDRILAIERSERPFQGHHEVRLEVRRRREDRTIPAGSFRVSTAQPLGTLVVYLLEAESDDGLSTWNFLDPWLKVGGDYPILREVRGGL